MPRTSIEPDAIMHASLIPEAHELVCLTCMQQKEKQTVSQKVEGEDRPLRQYSDFHTCAPMHKCIHTLYIHTHTQHIHTHDD